MLWPGWLLFWEFRNHTGAYQPLSKAMKVDRHGKAAALTPEQFAALLDAAPSPRYRALWAVQRFTAARISEALALRWADVAGQQVTYRRATTKCRATRQVPQAQPLQQALEAYRQAWAAEHGHQPAPSEALFPAAGSTTSPQTRQAADKALRKACGALGIEGVSLHSFRRTAAQQAVASGAPLHVVQALTGHKSLGSLGEYLQASETEVLAAIGA
jgi:integrase/recombinase XerD